MNKIFILSALFFMMAFGFDEINKTFFKDYAVKGYDVITYFTKGKAVEGNKKFLYKYKNANWLFSSKENLEKFKSDPEKYSPQYGGYCAYAVADGDTAGIDPDEWTIVDGKLYLNYDASIQDKWLKKQTAFIRQADKEWKKLLKKK